MKIGYTKRTAKRLGNLRPDLRKAFYKQVGFLAEDIQHPSLHAKKFDEANDIWQARINRDWRFYCTIKDDTYTIISIIPHPK